MTKFKLLLPLFFILFFAYSCISPKSLIYMQDKTHNRNYNNVYTQAKVITEKYKIQTKDYIYIRVITDNEKVAAYYNISGGGAGFKSTSYLVDDNGEIDFPSLGKIGVRGLTRNEVKQKLHEILKSQIDNFTLMVELTNTYFTILGEARAGNYPMAKDQITIYEAIAQAGDLTIYSKRKKLKIIRPTTSGISEIRTIDLTDKNLLDSEESYIYPNDIIYVEPINAKIFGLGQTFSFGLITSLISFYYILKTFK